MTLLFFASTNDKHIQLLQKKVENFHEVTEVYRTVNSLSIRLRNSLFDIAGVILVVFNHKDLDELLETCSILKDLSTIIIIPERDKHAMKKGLSFRPKFISYSNNDFNDVLTVLSKIIKSAYKDKTFLVDSYTGRPYGD